VGAGKHGHEPSKFDKMRELSQLAKDLLASQEGLSSMHLVSMKVKCLKIMNRLRICIKQYRLIPKVHIQVHTFFLRVHLLFGPLNCKSATNTLSSVLYPINFEVLKIQAMKHTPLQLNTTCSQVKAINDTAVPKLSECALTFVYMIRQSMNNTGYTNYSALEFNAFILNCVYDTTNITFVIILIKQLPY
jgi:hypothetical protein